MGLGGYLAARSEAEHFASEVRREQLEIEAKPDAELAESAALPLPQRSVLRAPSPDRMTP